ncbi:zf-DHHC-domain-containing protein [Ascodesmis nigricans]|uniref:Palmitoyltransferase n=1 Tax=Ascodesmis nigricans TaxID=341454 RepID=A0A4S2MMC9_9PEZI|nr:zf-DHHC-domain-containing protein [Ascodesmis nigricans]
MGARSARLANLWTARLMPFVLLGAFGFASWVLIHRVCTMYLIRKTKETSLAIALITIYAIILLLLVSSYIRVAVTVTFNPGYIPRGPAGFGDDANNTDTLNESEKPATSSSTSRTFSQDLQHPQPGETTAVNLPRLPSTTSLTDVLRSGPRAEHAPYLHHSNPPRTPNVPRPSGPDPFPSNLSLFTSKSIFVCESDGYPRWCSQCNIWKPDRAHHCSEMNRCIWRMDHFCPWVGGVVGETSLRYFYQVVVYALIYCLYLLIVCGIVLSRRGTEYDSETGATSSPDSTWISVLVLSAFFALFSFGMTYSTTQLIYRNLSTIDAISAGSKVYQLAIRDPNPPARNIVQESMQTQLPETHRRVWFGDRCYVICKTMPGENPWRQPTIIENFRDAMGGGNWWNWVGLWGVAPPGTLGGLEGFYVWNQQVVRRLKRDAGILGKEEMRGAEFEVRRHG